MSTFLAAIIFALAGIGTLIWFFAFSPRARHRHEVYRSTLLDVIRAQQPNGRGYTLQTEIERRLGWTASFGQLYVDLADFERSGIVSSRWGQVDLKHGRRPRLYWITADFPSLQHEGDRR